MKNFYSHIASLSLKSKISIYPVRKAQVVLLFTERLWSGPSAQDQWTGSQPITRLPIALWANLQPRVGGVGDFQDSHWD